MAKTSGTSIIRPWLRHGFVSYDPTADGKRFLVVIPDGAATAKIVYDIRVVLNWFQELEARAPTGRRQP